MAPLRIDDREGNLSRRIGLFVFTPPPALAAFAFANTLLTSPTGSPHRVGALVFVVVLVLIGALIPVMNLRRRHCELDNGKLAIIDAWLGAPLIARAKAASDIADLRIERLKVGFSGRAWFMLNLIDAQGRSYLLSSGDHREPLETLRADMWERLGIAPPPRG